MCNCPKGTGDDVADSDTSARGSAKVAVSWGATGVTEPSGVSALIVTDEPMGATELVCAAGGAGVGDTTAGGAAGWEFVKLG